MAKHAKQEPQRDINDAERAVESAFTSGKVDRAYITRQAQLDAADAVAMAGIAMESDAEADEAGKLYVIASSLGNKERIKDAREKERTARNKAKADHRAATRSAKLAYDAIKFSDPTKLGFMRFVQVMFLAHIVATLLLLILTSRDTVSYSTVNIIDWIMVVLEGVAFYFFVNRMKAARWMVIAISALGATSEAIQCIVNHNPVSASTVCSISFYIFLICYFLFSSRVKAVLVNDFSTTKGVDTDKDYVIERRGWPFFRNLCIYFVVFSVLGHWMEAGMCQFIRLGWVQGEYDPTNTMLWRDWLYPYPMEGAAVVFIALFLYPLFMHLKKICKSKWAPYVLSFLANALTCTLIEFFSGLVFNANLQNWDYTNNFCNFMGQVCLQNTIAFGVAASLIAWYVYPAMERLIARVRPAIMNIAFVVVMGIGGILFSLYLISPPEGIDLGTLSAQKQEPAAEVAYDQSIQASEVVGISIEALESSLDGATGLPQDARESIRTHIEAMKNELNAVNSELEALRTSSGA